MKKFSKVIVSSFLVAAIATSTAFGIGKNFISNDHLDDIIATKYNDGADFLKSNSSAPAFTDAEGLKAVDGDDSTKWVVGEDGAYTQLTFERPTSINNIEIKEVGSTVRKYHIDAWNGKEWVKVYNNDIIEGYYCAVINEIKTSALRMIVDEGKGAQIAELNAVYQRPVEYDRNFISMSYITENQYFHDWGPEWFGNQQMREKTFGALTDLYLIGMTQINGAGELVIVRQNYGSDNSTKAVYAADSNEADIMVNGDDMSVLPSIAGVRDFPKDKKGAIKKVKEMVGEANSDLRLWISLTIFKDTAFGGISPSAFSAFNDPQIRKNFVDQVIAFVKKYGLDGVDIDWEYPGTQEAWDSYTALINELAEALHAEGKLFSTAQSTHAIQLSTETLNKFDRINMMSYDQTNTPTGHHSSYQNSTILDVQKYLDKGVRSEKLVLGLAYYSSQGQVGWDNICNMMNDWEELDPGTNFFNRYTFNNVNLIRDRTLYAIKRNLGGVFSWHISCDMQWDHDYSLMRAQQETIDRFVKEVPTK